jgi:alpha-mannosidase
VTEGKVNDFKLYKDCSVGHDAWDIDSMYKDLPMEISDTAQVVIMEEGPLFVKYKVSRQIHRSSMVQYITVYSDKRRIDFDTKIDWREDHKLLKVNFPSNIYTNEAISEIQFGYLSRPNHQSKPSDWEKYEICNQKWSALKEENKGVAVLNDCKYGLNADGHSLNLTLLRAPMAPDMHADRCEHEFKYSFYYWNGAFSDSGIVREAYDINTEPVLSTGNAGKRSFFETDRDNIIIETVKPAEDGSGDIILRLYESMKMSTECTLTMTLDIKNGHYTTMLENDTEPVPIKNGTVALDFRPFEIKTIRLKL